ncbi:MAG: flagellar export protein FliJ [Lachnospiraceae bacterium]|jgi:flagellar FliJ protein|nr:flagellar export protein FliJ [Lachnospiraceae bacterium]
MAVFRYKMKNVLDVKLKLEDQAKAAFAEAMAALNAEEEKLSELFDRLEWYEEEGRRMRQDSIDVNDLRDNTRAIDNLKDQIEAQKENVRRAQAVVDRARNELNTAMQERKIQEKLRDNAFEEFKHELNAAESKEIDELVSYRHGRKIGL